MLKRTVEVGVLGLALSGYLACVCAQKPKQDMKPLLAVISPDHPSDSLNETVYTSQGEKLKDQPVVGLLNPPKVIKAAKAKYPKSLKSQKMDAKVIVSGVVSANGTFIDLKIKETTDPEASQSALTAASTYKFRPATVDGKPVAFAVNLDIEFRIY